MATEYLPLDITCRFRTPAFLPAFKGSTLRGAFGHALKKVSCALKTQACQACLLAKSCAYGLIFATEKLSTGRIAARPHPYILNPPVTEQQQYQQDESFSFNLVLLGPAVNFLPHIIYALEEMGKNGIGSGNKSGAGAFALLTVSTQVDTKSTSRVLLYEGDKMLRPLSQHPCLQLEGAGQDELQELAVELVTPLRMKEQNTFLASIDFSSLVRASLRRVSMIEEHYGDGQPELDYHGLLHKALAISTTHENVRWHEYKRYSNRQKQDMLFGGLKGCLHFQGDLAPFLPLLRYCQEINLGKQTAFGLGKIRIAAIQPKTS